jgi:hypothetical protein
MSEAQVWEKYKFEKVFDDVFEYNLDPETLFYVYKRLRTNILTTPLCSNIGALDAIFSLTRQILERAGGFDEMKELRKTYIETLKDFIKIIYMSTSGESVEVVSSETEAAAERLALAIRDALIAIASKASKCEDNDS